MRNLYTQKVGAIVVFFFLFLLSLSTFAQVGIGTINPDGNALMELDASVIPGGLLMPRVALRRTNDPFPLVGPVKAGMIVYNTATVGFEPYNVYPGFYYSNGTGSNWQRVQGGPNNNWSLNGNEGTDGTNFLGTSDNAGLRFKTGDTDAFEISGGNSASRGMLRAMKDGTAGSPVYSWYGASGMKMGLFKAGPNILAFSTNGGEAMRIMADKKVTIRSLINIDSAQLTVQSENANSTGIYGISGSGSGIKGVAATSGEGVVGLAVGGKGVYGQATTGSGVYGKATAPNAQGGWFVNQDPDGFGLFAMGGQPSFYKFDNTGTGAVITGRTYGTTSFARDLDGIGVAGFGANIGEIAFDTPPLGVGVAGMGKDAGVFGESRFIGKRGVYGRAQGFGAASGTGVYGENTLGPGFGVVGESSNIGVYGSGAVGAVFKSTSPGGFGADIRNTNSDGIGLIVAGQNLFPSTLAKTGATFTGDKAAGAGFAKGLDGTGLIGVGNNIAAPNLAVNGSGVAGTGKTVGVYGIANQVVDGIGVIGVGNGLLTYTSPANGAGVAGIGVDIGVYGRATAPAGFGVYSWGNLHATGDITADGIIYAPRGIITDGFAIAGRNIAIEGAISALNISATGDITAQGSKNFIIDDPRDPANKYLKHASIESNEILNLYRGVSTFDASGEVVVQLPDYYDAINKNASYQLTPIGAAMPNLYIAMEENNGTFKIAGGVPGKKVCWILTAERNDPYIRNNPEIRDMVVDKGADRGRYLAPESYGQTADQGILINRVKEMQIASAPAIAKQTIGAKEMQSITAEAKIVEPEQVHNLTIPFKTSRTENSGANELRDMPVIKAVKSEISSDIMKLADQTTSWDEVQSSEATQQTSESEHTPTKTVEAQDNN